MNKQQHDLNTVYESRNFDMSFRGTSNTLSSVKIFTNNNSFQIEKQISFDTDYQEISSIEYFAGSVLSSIMLTLLEQSKKRGSMIEEIEGVLKLSLENPLSLLGVKGYDQEPIIKKMSITVFLYIELEENDFDDYCHQLLKKCPIYNTLNRTMELEVNFKQLD